jgi:hypothetical protein
MKAVILVTVYGLVAVLPILAAADGYLFISDNAQMHVCQTPEASPVDSPVMGSTLVCKKKVEGIGPHAYIFGKQQYDQLQTKTDAKNDHDELFKKLSKSLEVIKAELKAEIKKEILAESKVKPKQ